MAKREGKVVVKLGQVTNAMAKLVQETRAYFEPGVSKNLKEEKKWKMKDYMQLAKYFNSSHIFAFSQSEEHNNLKIAALTNQVKTYYFKIEKYMHATEISKVRISPYARVNGYFVIPYNIEEKDPVMELVNELRENVKTSHLTTRVIVIKGMGNHNYLMSHYVMKKEEKKGKANVIKLALEEIGPRFELRLHKIEDGICTGNVIYHTYIEKSQAEIKERERKAREKEEEKEKRRMIQEENVKRKKMKNKKEAKENGKEEVDGKEAADKDASESESGSGRSDSSKQSGSNSDSTDE